MAQVEWVMELRMVANGSLLVFALSCYWGFRRVRALINEKRNKRIENL